MNLNIHRRIGIYNKLWVIVEASTSIGVNVLDALSKCASLQCVATAKVQYPLSLLLNAQPVAIETLIDALGLFVGIFAGRKRSVDKEFIHVGVSVG